MQMRIKRVFGHRPVQYILAMLNLLSPLGRARAVRHARLAGEADGC